MTMPSKVSNAYKITRPVNPQTSTVAEYTWLKLVIHIKPEWVPDTPSPTWPRKFHITRTPPNIPNQTILVPKKYELFNTATLQTIYKLKIHACKTLVVGHQMTQSASQN